jgi:hypothetical protein
LNVSEPVYLTGDGAILERLEKPEFIMCNEKKSVNWRALCLPKEMGVTEEEAF